MMTTDMIATLINQRQLMRCVERLERIDFKLSNEGIFMNYRLLQRDSLIMIIIIMSRKYLVIFLSVIVFDLNFFILWCDNQPVFVSALSKVWFVLLVISIREKFSAINAYLNDLCDKMDKAKMNQTAKSQTSGQTAAYSSNDTIIPIKATRPAFSSVKYAGGTMPPIAFIKPFDYIESSNEFAPTSLDSTRRSSNNKRSFAVGDELDQQLYNLCAIHDEICEVALMANGLFSFQMLTMIAYGFLSITAQLYFVYCGLAGQVFWKRQEI